MTKMFILYKNKQLIMGYEVEIDSLLPPTSTPPHFLCSPKPVEADGFCQRFLQVNEGVFSLHNRRTTYSLFELLGFLYTRKVSTLLCYDLALKLNWTEYLLLQLILHFAMDFCVKPFVTLFG